MSGNVWEWCDTWYNSYTKKTKVLRGGSYRSEPDQILILHKHGKKPYNSNDIIGFRCVKNIKK